MPSVFSGKASPTTVHSIGCEELRILLFENQQPRTHYGEAAFARNEEMELVLCIRILTWSIVLTATLIPSWIAVEESKTRVVSFCWLNPNAWRSIEANLVDDQLMLGKGKGKGKMAHRRKQHEELLNKLLMSDWALQQRARANLFLELQGSSFCDVANSAKNSSLFPMRQSGPPDVLVPWVFDASYSESGSIVSVVLANRDACLLGFDQREWERHMANLSLPVGPQLFSFNPKRPPLDSKLESSTIYCRFYDHRGAPLLAVESLTVLPLTQIAISGPGPLLVRCPVPHELRSRGRKLYLRLQRIAATTSRGIYGTNKDVDGGQSLMPTTKSFPLCPLPGGGGKHSRLLSSTYSEENSASSNQPTLAQRRVQAAAVVLEELQKNDHYPFNITACVATSASRIGYGDGSVGQSPRAVLTEWLEHLRLLGVEHVFVFDTKGGDIEGGRRRRRQARQRVGRSLDGEMDDDDADDDDDASGDSGGNSGTQSLRSLLSVYQDLGLVTVVDWPWAGCSSGFTCNHPVEDPRGRRPVQPPNRLEMALSVCYTRFRAASRWMLVLPDAPAEFLAMDASHRLDGERVSDLPDLIAVSTASFRNLAALEFTRQSYISCPQRLGEANESSPVLPTDGLHNQQTGDEESSSTRALRMASHRHLVGEVSAARVDGAGRTGTSALLVRTSVVVAADFAIGSLLTVEESVGAQGQQHLGLGARLFKGLAGRGGSLRGTWGSSSFASSNSTSGNAESLLHPYAERRTEARPARDNHDAQASEYSVAAIDTRVARTIVVYDAANLSSKQSLPLRCERQLWLPEEKTRKSKAAWSSKFTSRATTTSTRTQNQLCDTADDETFSISGLQILGDRYARALAGFPPIGEL